MSRFDAQDGADATVAIGFMTRDVNADVQAPFDDFALFVVHFGDLVARLFVHVLPKAGDAQHGGGAHGGLYLFGEGEKAERVDDTRADAKGQVVAADALGDVAERQEGEKHVVGAEIGNLAADDAIRGLQQVGVGQHRAFGVAGLCRRCR